ncbi:kinase-like domain-containing protein [Gorgonomyces haynaldii]|nr:kinase-like domain-containing protein [Gorgonomyces haynaldii]
MVRKSDIILPLFTFFSLIVSAIQFYRKRSKKEYIPVKEEKPSEELSLEQLAQIASDLELSDQSVRSIRSSRASVPAQLQAFVVSEQILGYGSHGTVVFKGMFEGRPVAIKRMLSDFYNVADHEVQLLQESDHHPNICRYFYREQAEGFMYIALELCECTLFDLITKRNEFLELEKQISCIEILQQMMRGLEHLHSLNIVHRDIKPHNILMQSQPKRPPRVVISDFGLGKRLADDQSSFHNTIATGGGTFGWRAPELLLSVQECSSESDGTRNVRVTRSIDIFSAGCVFYFALTQGEHPFGEKMSREINIIKGNFRLQHLDPLGDTGVLSKELIKRMIPRDTRKRLDAKKILEHPFFWDASRRLLFLQDVSDRLEIESREFSNSSKLLVQLEKHSNRIIGPDWTRKINKSVLEDLSKYRTYDGRSIQDLLRALRNKKHHYHELPEDVKKDLGSNPSEFMSFWTTKFPSLFTHVYLFVQGSKELSEHPTLRSYFQ